MKILGIEHIGIAVKKLDKDSLFWKKVLKISPLGMETVKSQGVTTDIYDTGKGKVELLEALHPDSPISKFLATRGPGLHHICFEVDDIYSALKVLSESGVRVINEKPLEGIDGHLVVFIHPKSTGGVLVELVQKP